MTPKMTTCACRSFLYYPTPRVTPQVTYISRPMAPHSPRKAKAFGLLLLAVSGACAPRDNGGAHTPSPPPAEFLVATQDSTFWISTTGAKVRARGAPLTLARYDGRFYEIFIADDDRSYSAALLVGLRVYRRDLEHGDSAVIFEDSIVPRVAREYSLAHPRAHRLSPDEDGDEDPPTQALADLQVVDVHGPYLSYEYHVDVTMTGLQPWHATRRGVIDLRSGKPALVSDLFPSAVASALIDSGRRELTSAIDSVRGDSRESARQAVAALSRARFDDRSFVLTVPDSNIAVEFDVPQRGADVPDEVLPLNTLSPPSPSWWAAIEQDFAHAENDLDRWRRLTSAGYDLVAHYDSSAQTARLVLVAGANEWPVRIVAAPVLHTFWLDRPALDSAQRRALTRAFNEASLYDESTRTVRDTRPGAHITKPRFAEFGSVVRRARHHV
jgi:hypothetical protein